MGGLKRPQGGVFKRQRAGDLAFFPGGDRFPPGGGCGHYLVTVQNFFRNGGGDGLVRGVFHRGVHFHLGGGFSDFRGFDEDAPVFDVHGVGFREPHMAVDAAARIPAGGVGGIVHPDGDGVFLAEFQEGRDVHAEGAVPVFPFAGQVSVYIDFWAGHDAVKIQIELVALGVRRYFQRFAVPADAVPREFACFIGKVHAVWPFHTPVMRQVQGTPVFVVETGAGGMVRFAGSGGGLRADDFPLVVFKGDFTDAGPVALVVARDGDAEVARLAGFVFHRVFLGVVLSGSFVFNGRPAFSVTGAFQLEKMVVLFFPQDVDGFHVHGASHVHSDFLPAFAAVGTPAGGLVPVHGIVRRIAGFLTGGSGESHGFSRFRLCAAIRHFSETGKFPVPIQALRFGGVQGRRHEAGDAERSNAEGRACNVGEHICGITTGNLQSCKIFIQQNAVSARIPSAGLHVSGGMTCSRRPVMYGGVFRKYG